MSLHQRTRDVLAFAHLGDLHLTRAAERNYADLLAIVAQIEISMADRLDFVVLPGDNADNGLPEQYRLAAVALKMLSIPVHAITGDHDMEQGSLDAFHAVLASDPLPKSVVVDRHQCLFLDISGPGSGGPDFRMSADQMAWVKRELESASAAGRTVVVFMHSYPADLQGEGEGSELDSLFRAHDVALVDMGHTHYNELANTGHTIFAATRSTGQIEEGPVGYSIATVDNDVVGWRFRLLDDPFPFVLITSPADHRLARGERHVVEAGGRHEVHALVLGPDEIDRVECRVGDGEWQPMSRNPQDRVWAGQVQVPDEHTPELTVRAATADGRPGQHTIRLATRWADAERPTAGSDAASIGAWPENGIHGTQLGPNRNGRHW